MFLFSISKDCRKVNSNSWSTPLIPLKIGVYQGDPLSVVIFNTVINTMVEVIKTRPDLGYHITNRHSVNLLQPSFISHSSIIMHHHNFWRSFNPSTPTSRQRSIQTAGLHHLFHCSPSPSPSPSPKQLVYTTYSIEDRSVPRGSTISGDL